MLVKEYKRGLMWAEFIHVYTEKFKHPHEDTAEEFCAYWQPQKGLLLTFDTDLGYINQAHVHYNWVPNVDPKKKITFPKEGSGGFKEIGGFGYIWLGFMDARTNLFVNLLEVEGTGMLLPRWREKPILVLMHHGDWAEIRPITSIKEQEKRIREIEEEKWVEIEKAVKKWNGKGIMYGV